MQFNVRFLKLSVFLCALIPYLWGLFYLTGISNDNYWMIRAFDADESGTIIDIQTMFLNDTWKPLSYIYGSAHSYFCLIFLKLQHFFSEINFADIAWTSRIVNGIALLILSYLLLSRFTERRSALKWGYLLLVCLLFTGLNFEYALNAKPEHLQALFVVCSIFLMQAFFDTGKSNRIFWAGLFAGFSFATKYAGLLVLAFEGLCLLLYYIRESTRPLNIRQYFMWNVLLVAGGFCGVALLGPYLLIDFSVVREVLSIHSHIIGTGFVFLDDKHWYEWFGLLFRRDVFWWGFFLIGLFLKLGDFRSGQFVPICSSGTRVSVYWILFYSIYLLFFVREKQSRYLIILLPFLFFYFFSKLAEFEVRVKSAGHRLTAIVIYVSVILCVVYASSTGWRVTTELLKRPSAPRILAADWLLENVDTQNSVAYDLYTYVPPVFRKRIHEPYLSGYDVIGKSADYVVTSMNIMSRYLDRERAKYYREGHDVYMSRHLLYSNLYSNTLPGYRLVQDFGEVRIYEKNKGGRRL